MPELPEVETIVRQIRPKTVGRKIKRVRLASKRMAKSAIGSFERVLAGLVLERIDRHGKWMFFRLSGGNTLVIHLGMTGRLGVFGAKESVLPHTHLRLALDEGGEELRFSDARRFGELLLCDPQAMETRFGPDRLGPEATQITLPELSSVVGKTRRSVKVVLLDQRAIAGIGNIYADEVLFEARLDPALPARDLQSEEVTGLHRAIRSILRRAIRHSGTTIRDYVTSRGVPGEFGKYLRVYGRVDQPCKKCSFPIELRRTIIAGRPTCWCPRCQARK